MWLWLCLVEATRSPAAWDKVLRRTAGSVDFPSRDLDPGSDSPDWSDPEENSSALSCSCSLCRSRAGISPRLSKLDA